MNRLNSILQAVRCITSEYYVRLSRNRIRVGVLPELADAFLNYLRATGANIVTVLFYRGYTYFQIKTEQ